MKKTIKAHFFDMDHTLIDADCDVTWKEFMIAEGIAPASDEELARKFFADYNRGELDTDAFQLFQLREFIGKTPQEMACLCNRHFERVIRSRVYPRALKLIEQLKKDGYLCGIITSTNIEIARSVARFFGVEVLAGTELELRDGRFTGHASEFVVKEGKVLVLQRLCCDAGIDVSESAYYGDSINDRYVLEACGEAVAVNPSAELRRLAIEKNWRIESFKDS